MRITGARASPYRPPWLRNVSDSRPSSPLTALDIVLIASAAVATVSVALYIALNGLNRKRTLAAESAMEQASPQSRTHDSFPAKAEVRRGPR